MTAVAPGRAGASRRRRMLPEILETEGGKLILVRKFAKTAEGPSFPLIREAFAMGDAPPGGFDEDEMMGKFKGKKR